MTHYGVLWIIWIVLCQRSVSWAFLRQAGPPVLQQFRCVSSLVSRRKESEGKGKDDADNENTGNDNDKEAILSVSSSSSSAISQAQVLQAQLQSLRQEIQQDVQNLQQYKQSKIQKKQDKVDQWIDALLVAVSLDDRTQMLHSVETVAQRLMDERFSPEQVNAIFERITQEDPTSRVESPLVELLVDACNLVDCREEQDNPNKRWKGRVEMKLRRKMFAMKWGIELEEEGKETNLYD